MSEQTRSSNPTEEQLLAFIEGELSTTDSNNLLQQLSSNSKAQDGLQQLSADRETLQNLLDPEPPEGLLDDCLSTIERSLLISDDPIAPILEVPRRQSFNWTRIAAAAAILIIAPAGGYWIFQSLTVGSGERPRFVVEDKPVEKNPSDESDSLSSDNLLATSQHEGVLDANDPGKLNDQGEPFDNRLDPTTNALAHAADTNLLASDTNPSHLTDVQANVGASVSDADHSNTPSTIVADDDPRQWAASHPTGSDEIPVALDATLPNIFGDDLLTSDPGLRVHLSALDRDAALAYLRAEMDRSPDMELFYNTPLQDTLPHLPPDIASFFPASPNVFANSTSGNSGNAGSSSDSNSNANQNANGSPLNVLEQYRFVSMATQQEYHESGFEYTVVGTPTQIHRMLRAINRDSDIGRVQVKIDNDWIGDHSDDARPPIKTLLDLMNPEPPRGKDLTRAILWWTNPERGLPLAEQLRESCRPEPMIRVPIYIAGRR